MMDPGGFRREICMSRSATDLLRVIAVTYVVFNHATWNGFVEIAGPNDHAGVWFFAVLNQLGKPSVLLFLFLSGFAFGVHPKWGARENVGETLRARFAFSAAFYRNRALRILPPYFLMSLIGFAIVAVPNWYSAIEPAGTIASVLSIANIATNGITAGIDFAAGLLDGDHMFHLYFVALLCYLYALFPWIVGRTRVRVRAVEGSGGRSRASIFSFALAVLAIFAVYLLVDPHNRFIQSRIPYITDLAPIVQERLSGHATSWTILMAYALPFFIGGVRAGQLSAQRRNRPENQEQGARDSFEPAMRNFWNGPRIACMVAAGIAFAFVFGDFLFHVFALGQFPDSAGRIWRPTVVLYALLALVLIWMLTNDERPAGSQESEPSRGGLRAAFARMMSGERMRGLARLSFLVYLTHPLLQFAFSGLPFEIRVPLILGLAWPLALGLSALAQRSRFAGFLLGEGDRHKQAREAVVPSPARDSIGEPALVPGR